MESIDTTQSASRWGLYPWFPEHGEAMIHPHDIGKVTALTPNGKVFEVIGNEGDYLILSFGEFRFRAKPELFRSVDRPLQQIGDVVEVVSKGEHKSGTVAEIHWHHKRNEPFYFLIIDGKQSAKRFWNSDFQ